jgi:MFS family permease
VIARGVPELLSPAILKANSRLTVHRPSSLTSPTATGRLKRKPGVVAGVRRQWLLITLAAVTRFASGVLMGTAMAVFVSRGGSPLAVSLVATAFFGGMMLFSPVWGAIADVTGRRRAVMVGTGAVATLFALPLAVVHRFDLVLGSLVLGEIPLSIGFRFLYAIFAAGFSPVCLAIVSYHGGAEGRGRSMGVFNSARSGGYTGGNLVVGVLIGLLAPPSLYLVVAAVSAVSTLAAALIADPTPDPDREPTAHELADEVTRRLFPAAGEREHLRSHGLGWLYVALAIRNMTVLGVMALMAPYLVDQVGVPAAIMGAILAINHGAQVPSMYALGIVADRAGRKPLIVVGMAGSGLFALLAAAATLPAAPLFGVPAWGVRATVATLAMATLGVSYSGMTTGAVAFIGDVAPRGREAELLGLRSTAKGTGGVFGPIAVGALATAVGYESAFVAASVLAFSAALLSLFALVESRPDVAGRPAVTDD